MEPLESNKTPPTSFSGTVLDELDQLDVIAGKIGLNSAEKSTALLTGLDQVYDRIQTMENESQSRKLAETQFDTILARLHREPVQFLRDLGGVAILTQLRDQYHPGADRTWWYLDEWLAKKRQNAMKRTLMVGGIVILVLVVLGLLYQRFLAPDPITVARYTHEQNAQDKMANGDWAGAMADIDEGLKVAPDDGSFLVLKGVVLEKQDQNEPAQTVYHQAEQAFQDRESFLVTRAQSYAIAGLYDEALQDTQEATKSNPQNASAFLIAGQVHENLKMYAEAKEDYDHAYEAANQSGQDELAAVARTRTAMLLQTINAQLPMPSPAVTPTP